MDRSRQALVGFTMGTVAFLGAAVLIDQPLIQNVCFGAMTVCSFIAIGIYFASAIPVNGYEVERKE
jgi:hypothetical protein